MSIKWSEIVNDVTSKPFQLKDMLVFSNTTDGGTNFDVSKRAFIDELIAFILANGFSFPVDKVITGSGSGIQASVMKASDIDLDGSLYVSHEDHHNGNDYLIYIDKASGEPQLNAPSGTDIYFTISNSQKMIVRDEGLEITSANTLVVGGAIDGVGTGASVHIIGTGDTDATNALTVSNSTGGAAYNLQVRDDGIILTDTGTIGKIETASFAIAGTAFHNSTDYALKQKATGFVNINAVTSLKLGVDGITGQIDVFATNVRLANDIGLSMIIGSGTSTGSKIEAFADASGVALFVRLRAQDGTDLFNLYENGLLSLKLGTTINEFSTDGTLAGDSDDAIPTEKAVKTYVDTSVTDIVFSSYIVGSTLNPLTDETTSAAAPVLAEMTHTFTPVDAANKIEVFFSGEFNNDDNKDDRGVRCGIFIDGVLEEETECGGFSFRGDPYHATLSTFWQGTLTAASHTITIRYWGTGDDTIGVDNHRRMLIKEIRE